ncbi:hypothetical protein GQ56_0103315 [Burkholderia paludis]|nr:hypothetical protein GQ56_0103315 [Burkholderia paludis]
MKSAQCRETVRLGDAADRDGTATGAALDLKHLGIGVAPDGHGEACPKCGGIYPLPASGPRMHRGRQIKYHGRRIGCTTTVVRA